MEKDNKNSYKKALSNYEYKDKKISYRNDDTNISNITSNLGKLIDEKINILSEDINKCNINIEEIQHKVLENSNSINSMITNINTIDINNENDITTNDGIIEIVEIKGKTVLVDENNNEVVIPSENSNFKSVESSEGIEITTLNLNGNLFSFGIEQSENVDFNTMNKYTLSDDVLFLKSSSGRSATIFSNNLIPVNKGDKIVIKYESEINEANTSILKFYDKYRNNITKTINLSNSTYIEYYKARTVNRNFIYTIPDNVRYVCLGFRTYNETVAGVSNNAFYKLWDIGLYKVDKNDNINYKQCRWDKVSLKYYNSLGVNSITTLKGIDDSIYDSINKSNEGTYIYHKKCHEFKFYGNEDWKIINTNSTHIKFQCELSKKIKLINARSNKFSLSFDTDDNIEYFKIVENQNKHYAIINISKIKLETYDIDGFRIKLKHWLDNNSPLSILCELLQEETYETNYMYLDSYENNTHILFNTSIIPNTKINIIDNLEQIKKDNNKMIQKIEERYNSNNTKKKDIIDLDGFVLLSEEIGNLDDSLYLNQKISNIINSKKKVLVDKIFDIEDAIIIKESGIYLKGINNGGFIQHGANKPTIQLGENGTPCTNSIFESLLIKGKNTYELRSGDGILVDFSYGCYFDKVSIYNCGGYALRCINESNKNGLWITKFYKCIFSQCYSGGVLFNHSNGAQFNDISFISCTTQSNGYKIKDNTVYKPKSKEEASIDYGDGFNISGTAVSIIACDSEGNSGAGIKVNSGYASGITIIGNYTEPNLLTDFYFCSSGYKKDFLVKGNYLMSSSNHKLGTYYFEKGFPKGEKFNTQFIDNLQIYQCSNSNNTMLFYAEDEILATSGLPIDFNDGKGSGIKITMRYKSKIEHGYMSYGMSFKNKYANANLATVINSETLKSNICKVISIQDNIITLDTDMVLDDDTWLKLYIHENIDELPEYKGTYGFVESNVSNYCYLYIAKEHCNINKNTITLNGVDSEIIKKINNNCYVTAHKTLNTGSQTLFNYIKIPISTENYTDIVYYNGLWYDKRYREGYNIIDTCGVWGLPISYNNKNHEIKFIKIERNDIAYIKDEQDLKYLLPIENLRVYLYNKGLYLTYIQGKFYKDDGLEFTI